MKVLPLALPLAAALTLPIALLLPAPHAHSAPTALEEAVNLALTHAPDLTAERTAAALPVSDWKTALELGYRTTATTDQAKGSSVAVTLEIPLTGGKERHDRAQALADIEGKSEQRKAALLKRIEELQKQHQESSEARQLADFERDHLKYVQEGVKSGQFEATKLWEAAEKTQVAAQKATRLNKLYRTSLDTTAIEYGGNDWKRLKTLIERTLTE